MAVGPRVNIIWKLSVAIWQIQPWWFCFTDDLNWIKVALLLNLVGLIYCKGSLPSLLCSLTIKSLVISGTFCMTWIPRRVLIFGEMSISAWPPWWRLWERMGMTGYWCFPHGVAFTTGRAPTSTRSVSRGESFSASLACRPMCLSLSMRNSLLVSF